MRTLKTKKIHKGKPFASLAQATKQGTIDRRSAEEWTKILGVSRQRYHQIRILLGLPSRQSLIYKAVTAPLAWKTRAQTLWQLGVYDREGNCWKSPFVNFRSVERLGPRSKYVLGSRRGVLHRLRNGYAQNNARFDPPTCGHDWCIKPEHQKLIGFGIIPVLRALPRAERVATALEAGLKYGEIARREGISPGYVAQINRGDGMHGVRDKYPIRAIRHRKQSKPKDRDGSTPRGRDA